MKLKKAKDNVLLNSSLEGLNLVSRGKVRDIYDFDERLLMISTDRISAFDVILPDPIPLKGKILNQMTVFWLKMFEDIVPNHLISTDFNDFPEACRPYKDILDGRSMLVNKAKPIMVECIVRGYISGSGWKDYKKTGSVCGIRLPEGLKEASRLQEPIFTPSTKADVGQHDENISFDQACDIIGKETADAIKNLSISIYNRAHDFAAEKGIIIADTKMEFGIFNDRIMLIDEVITPDSSRFWPHDLYEPGKPQMSFDKQFVRDYLDSLGWNHSPPAPKLPEGIINKTSQRYLEAYIRLTGKDLT